jgi:hypothetical protein
MGVDQHVPHVTRPHLAAAAAHARTVLWRQTRRRLAVWLVEVALVVAVVLLLVGDVR